MQDQYSYQLSASRNAFGLALFGSLTMVAAWFAITNREALHLFTALDFTAVQASVAYGALALVFAAAAFISLVMLRVSLKGPMQLELGQHSLRAPKASMRSELIDIPYNQIQKVVMHSIQHQQLLVLSSPLGQSRLSSFGFEDDAAFERFYKNLTFRIGRESVDK